MLKLVEESLNKQSLELIW